MGLNEKKRVFLIGTAKAGTTSLYNYLKQHPEIFLPNIKEIHYFSEVTSSNKLDFLPPKKGKTYHTKIIKDREAYFSLFQETKNQKYLADFSPSYLYDQFSAEKIHQEFPNAKIMVILREPIGRAYSQYLMERRIGIEKQEDFFTALKDDYENNRKRIWGKDHLYVDHGFYYKQLKRYTELFSEDQILCLSFDDLVKNPSQVLKKIVNFLEIDNSFNFKLGEVHNKYKTHRNIISKKLIEHKEKIIYLTEILPKFAVKIIKNILFKKAEKPPLDIKAEKYLKEVYLEDYQKLKEISCIDQTTYNYLTKRIYD